MGNRRRPKTSPRRQDSGKAMRRKQSRRMANRKIRMALLVPAVNKKVRQGARAPSLANNFFSLVCGASPVPLNRIKAANSRKILEGNPGKGRMVLRPKVRKARKATGRRVEANRPIRTTAKR